MQGASISRWTMAYFAAAITLFVTALALLALGFGDPSTGTDSDTLVVIHLIAVGWLGLLFSGALLQFVPVLAATQLKLRWLALPALVAIVGGLAGLLAGFLAIGGRINVDPAVMFVGASLLIVGFSCLILSLGATLLSRQPLGISSLFVLVGLVVLAVTIVMGWLFAGLLSDVLGLPGISAWFGLALPYHATAGILGWMSLTAIGVSYRLFAMFMLAPEKDERDRSGFFVAILALTLLIAALLSGAILDSATHTTVTALALASAMALLGIYVFDISRMFSARRRRLLELNSISGLASLPFLVLGMMAFAATILTDSDRPFGPTAFYLLGFGWLSGLGLAQLYKVVPFLTWLETYGAVMGRSPVPRVQDLVDERWPKFWFSLYYASVAIGAAGLFWSAPVVFRAASVGQLLSVVLLAAEFLRARRLDHVPVPFRLPPGAVRPHLVFARIASKEE